MILLLSTAFHLFWLGRYSERLRQFDQLSELLTPLNPHRAYLTQSREVLTEIQMANLAKKIVTSYAWKIENTPASVRQYLKDTVIPDAINAIENNVQNVRGVVDQDTFELFNLVKRLEQSGSHRTATLQLHACNAAMARQNTLVKLFWEIGSSLELIDNQVRLQHPLAKSCNELLNLIQQLPANTRWRDLDKSAGRLAQTRKADDFYNFYQLIEQMMAEGV